MTHWNYSLNNYEKHLNSIKNYQKQKSITTMCIQITRKIKDTFGRIRLRAMFYLPFSDARYNKAMHEILGFGTENCLFLPGLAWK